MKSYRYAQLSFGSSSVSLGSTDSQMLDLVLAELKKAITNLRVSTSELPSGEAYYLYIDKLQVILFGSALEAPAQAKDLDLACDGVPGWKLYELGARLEEELQVPLDIVPLSPPTRFTRLIETRGKVLL